MKAQEAINIKAVNKHIYKLENKQTKDMCSNNFPPAFTDIKNVNRDIRDMIDRLPDGVRKEVRLLTKQYMITELSQEPPIRCNGHIVMQSPVLIKYKAIPTRVFEDNEEFTWTIEGHRMH
jgi:hypothetical protein